jgi:hypothetical protein
MSIMIDQWKEGRFSIEIRYRNQFPAFFSGLRRLIDAVAPMLVTARIPEDEIIRNRQEGIKAAIADRRRRWGR